MPLIKSTSAEALKKNIEELIASGRKNRPSPLRIP